MFHNRDRMAKFFYLIVAKCRIIKQLHRQIKAKVNHKANINLVIYALINLINRETDIKVK